MQRGEFLTVGNLIQDFVASFPMSFKLFSNPQQQQQQRRVPEHYGSSSTSTSGLNVANEVMEHEDIEQGFATADPPMPTSDNTIHEQSSNWQFHSFVSPEDATRLIYGAHGILCIYFYIISPVLFIFAAHR